MVLDSVPAQPKEATLSMLDLLLFLWGLLSLKQLVVASFFLCDTGKCADYCFILSIFMQRGRYSVVLISQICAATRNPVPAHKSRSNGATVAGSTPTTSGRVGWW